MTMISLVQNCVERAQGRENKLCVVFHEPGLFQHKIMELFCLHIGNTMQIKL